MGIQLGGLIGVVGGIIFGLTGLYFGRKKAQKEGGLDEVHDHIWRNARSYSWYITLIGIYAFFFLHLFGVELSIAAVLALLIFIQLSSWAIIGLVLSSTIYNDGSKRIIVFTIAFISILMISLFIIFLVGRSPLFS